MTCQLPGRVTDVEVPVGCLLERGVTELLCQDGEVYFRFLTVVVCGGAMPYDPQVYWDEVNTRRRSDDYMIHFYQTISQHGRFPTWEHELRAGQKNWIANQFETRNWQSVLDAGCGPGFWFQLWRDLGISAWGVDRSAEAQIRAERFAERIGFPVQIACAPLHRLPFEDGQFDVVVTVKVLLHTPPEDIRASVSELCRVSRNLLLLEIQWQRPVDLSSAPHVFQHDLTAILKDVGGSVLTSETQQGNQHFVIAASSSG